MNEIADLFPETYEDSRTRFRENLAVVQHFWPQAQLSQQRISAEEDLTIDWIYSDAREKNQKVFILTIGEHGVEGYVGSAMQQRFIERYLARLDPETTGLLLVHAINPWGMKYHCRVNANNVDLNRNFIYDGVFDPAFNPAYDTVTGTLNPRPNAKPGCQQLDFQRGAALASFQDGRDRFSQRLAPRPVP